MGGEEEEDEKEEDQGCLISTYLRLESSPPAEEQDIISQFNISLSCISNFPAAFIMSMIVAKPSPAALWPLVHYEPSAFLAIG